MVSGVRSRDRQRSSANDSRNRGQIILIGAITLAFIVLGIVVVFNGILYTEALSSGSSSQSAADASTVEYELETGVGGITHQGNLEWEEDYEDQIDQSTSDFSEDYLDSKANSRPVITEAEYSRVNESATVATGEEIDGLNIDVSVGEGQIGHLEFELESGDNGGELVVDVDGESITITDNGGSFEVEGCDIESEEIRIELVTGDVIVPTDNECDVSLIDPTESYDNLKIKNDGDDEGTYDIVGKEFEDIDHLGGTHDGAWTVDIDVTYESNDVSYERTKTVDIYEGQ